MTGRAIDDPVQLARAARIVRGALDRKASRSPAAVKEFVARTRKEQGLPPTIEDPVVLDQIAQLLDEAGPAWRDPTPPDEVERQNAEKMVAETGVIERMSHEELRELAARPNPKQALKARARSTAEKIAWHEAELAKLRNETEAHEP